jgi:aspartyl aminopeptidase
MSELKKLAGLVIQFIDANEANNRWLREIVDKIANHGYKTVEEAQARATEIIEWEYMIRTTHKQN